MVGGVWRRGVSVGCRFEIESEVFERFPGLRIPAVVARGINNSQVRPAITAQWRAVWADAARAAEHGNAQSHPRVAPWRERFRAIGVSGKEFPSSVEALLRRALKGGEPFAINPLVDAYNAVSLRHVVPAGGFDLDDLSDGLLELRLTRPGDGFTALDAAEPLAVPAGEIAYATDATILTRHFVWRQSRAGLVTRATRDVILLAEVLGELGPGVAEHVRDDFSALLAEHYGVTPSAAILDAASPSAEFA
jgi:DNA/RNA-binding domain of Phe-tRNA-synthetase-like protein